MVVKKICGVAKSASVDWKAPQRWQHQPLKQGEFENRTRYLGSRLPPSVINFCIAPGDFKQVVGNLDR